MPLTYAAPGRENAVLLVSCTLIRVYCDAIALYVTQAHIRERDARDAIEPVSVSYVPHTHEILYVCRSARKYPTNPFKTSTHTEPCTQTRAKRSHTLGISNMDFQTFAQLNAAASKMMLHVVCGARCTAAGWDGQWGRVLAACTLRTHPNQPDAKLSHW